MKRIIALGLAALLLLGGCGKSGKPGGTTTTQEPEVSLEGAFSAQTDFLFLDMTPAQAQETFWEPTETHESEGGRQTIYLNEKGEAYRFRTEADGSQRLVGLSLYTAGHAPVRGIQVGDTLEAVLDKFPGAGTTTLPVEGGSGRVLYGRYQTVDKMHSREEYARQTYGLLWSLGGQPAALMLCDGEGERIWQLLFWLGEMDGKTCVSAISIANPQYYYGSVLSGKYYADKPGGYGELYYEFISATEMRAVADGQTLFEGFYEILGDEMTVLSKVDEVFSGLYQQNKLALSADRSSFFGTDSEGKRTFSKK